MRRIVPFAVGLLAALVGARASTTAPQVQGDQSQRPSFRAGVEIVDVDVSVLDQHRQPIVGLTAEDFTVLEDGTPRPIAAFTPVDLPPRALPSAPWMAEIAPDTRTNDLQREGRLVVVLFDRSITLLDGPNAKTIAAAAIEQLRPADLAAVVYSEYGIPQNFTTDRRRLLAAIRQPAVGLPEGDNGASGPCFCGTCTLERIEQVAEGVRDVRQRRKILFAIASNLAVTGRGGCGAAISDARSRALRAIDAANLTVYVLDPSGVRTLAATASSAAPTNRGGLANLQRIGNLQILPDHTGGRTVFGNEPARALPELFRESNAYYVLGFHPAHADARFHDITVKVNRSGAIVQARRGYYAAGAKPPATVRSPKGMRPALHNAIAGLWPAGHLPLTISAAPVARPGLRSAEVVVTVGVERPPRGDEPFNVLIGAFDRNGRGLAYQQGQVTAAPDGGEGLRAGYDLVSHLELRPGRYELRAAVEDAESGEVGSVYTYVDVPSFLTEFVSLSGLFLRTTPTPPVGWLNAASPLTPFAPASRRAFGRADRVSAWLEIYQGIRRPAMPGYVVTEIRDETDTRVFHQETRTLASDVGANRAIQMTVDLPLEGLTPGQYLLAIEVRQGLNRAQRDLRFTVK